MAGNDRQTQTTKTTIDPATQQYILQNRGMFGGYGANLGFGSQTGLQGLDAYLNPYLGSQEQAMMADFARQRALGLNTAADFATRAGAFGGDRSAILSAMALNDVNRSEASGLAGLRGSAWNTALEAMLGERARVGNLGLGMAGLAQGWAQPLEQTNTQTIEMRRSLLPQLLGLGAQVGSAFIPGGTAAKLASQRMGAQQFANTLEPISFSAPNIYGGLGFPQVRSPYFNALGS